METSFKQTTSNKVERYRLFLPQFELLISDEKEEISVLANTAAALREAFGFFWVGFYLVKDNQLILGPFQGSTACYRIHKGKGVCGTSWAEARTLIVPNVEQFPGHIACSSLSRSEIVVPILANGQVKGSFGYILQNSISHGKMIEMISSIVLLASSDTAGT